MEDSQAYDNIPEGTQAVEEITKISISILTRIMYHVMPLNTKINVDTKEAMSQCVSEFAAVLIREARQVAREDSRVIVSGDDIISSLDRLGFSDYVAPLSLFLRRYRESQGIVPHGWQAELPQHAPPAVAAASVEIQQQPPAVGSAPVEIQQQPELDLTLSLALPGPRDVTELELHEDVYKLWPGAAGRLMPPAGGDHT